jgi:hypothetical protein
MTGKQAAPFSRGAIPFPSANHSHPTKFMIDILRILFYRPPRFRDRGFYENECDVEKCIFEPRPASPGPPVVPRSSRDGSKPITHRFQETVVPENQSYPKGHGFKVHGLFVSGPVWRNGKIAKALTPERLRKKFRRQGAQWTHSPPGCESRQGGKPCFLLRPVAPQAGLPVCAPGPEECGVLCRTPQRRRMQRNAASGLFT